MSEVPAGSDAVGRERDFERFLTFVDAIVAIAITLLVLPLVDVAGSLPDGGSVSTLLHDNRDQIWAFFLSFLVISNLWLAQHHVLHHVVMSNAMLVRLMLLWTLTIVILPFPTALVAGNSASEEPATKILYVGTMAVSALILALMCLVIRRHRGLRDSDDAPDATSAFARAAAFLVALLLMLAFPGLGYWPMVLLALPDRVLLVGRVVRRRRPD